MKILSCLAYFDIFNYPLSIDDICRYTGFSIPDVEEELFRLNKQEVIFELNGFYSLQNDKSLSSRRIKGNDKAKEYLLKAEKKAKLISKFPFVRGVYISGSLSKNFMGEDGDVDYFIVTKPNRLWVSRTLLIAYKKVFLFNSRKYFCVNYFVDDESLEISEKNRFTATELVTLMPMSNYAQYNDLINSNLWIKEYYKEPDVGFSDSREFSKSIFQKIVEPILNTKMGDKLDAYFLRITLKKWNKKFGKMNQEDFELAMKSSKKVSKHHPSNFQKKVLQEYDSRMEMINKKLKVTV